MVSVYSLIGKNVFGLISGKIVGAVSNVVICEGKLCKLCVINDESDFEVNVKDILSFGEFIMLKNEEFLPVAQRDRVLGSVVLSQEGNVIGVLDDILLNEHMSIFKFMILNNYTITEIDFKNVFNMGNGVINLKGNKKISKKIIKKSVDENKKIEYKHERMAVTKISNQQETGLSNSAYEFVETMPNKVLAGYYFLLNRIIKEPIFSKNGVLIKQGDKVDKNMLMMALRENKLAELVVRAK